MSFVVPSPFGCGCAGLGFIRVYWLLHSSCHLNPGRRHPRHPCNPRFVVIRDFSLRLCASVPLCEIRMSRPHAPHSISNADFPSRQMDQTSPLAFHRRKNSSPPLLLALHPVTSPPSPEMQPICVQLPCVTSVSIRNSILCTFDSIPGQEKPKCQTPSPPQPPPTARPRPAARCKLLKYRSQPLK